MPELLKANLSPVNLLAKKHLSQLGQGYDPRYLYALQLGAWALEENKLELSDQGEDLPEVVGRLFLADQEKLGSFLEDEHDLKDLLHGRPSPEEVAALFLEHLLERLSAEASG